ncbi:MAG: thermonuclease family protein [Gammaproteobacteria bacterium]|nr:thermonuclease family protein [Gammaproteobacteria bacterium]
MVLAAFLAPTAAAGDASQCPADRIDARVTAAIVYDGDTLELTDGRKVRLLGIDTPEIGRDGAPSEPYAEAAHRLLERLAAPGEALHLRLDAERFDRYGRTLAHVFRADGSNLQASLLDAGYATALVVPPNQWSARCYAALESRARADGRGIWALERYRPVPAESLPESARGFRLVTGRVQRVGESRGNLWLNLAPRMAVRIPRDDLVYFGGDDPRRLLGRRLEVRGWVQRRRGELRVTVRHPAAIRVLD